MPSLTAVPSTRQLRKRDQSYAPFDAQKILHAITAAGRATSEFTPAAPAKNSFYRLCSSSLCGTSTKRAYL